MQAQVASVQFDVFPNIVLNGQVNRLAPGARIWNQQNLITMPASLYAQQFVVRYTLNNEKQIDRIWILRDEEQ